MDLLLGISLVAVGCYLIGRLHERGKWEREELHEQPKLLTLRRREYLFGDWRDN